MPDLSMVLNKFDSLSAISTTDQGTPRQIDLSNFLTIKSYTQEQKRMREVIEGMKVNYRNRIKL